MKKPVQKIIRVYQSLRPDVPACRFAPTCSEYSLKALDKYGILNGGLLSLKRIFKCHPWSKGGQDPLI